MSYTNCLLEFRRVSHFGGFDNRQSFDRLHINCLLEFRQSFDQSLRGFTRNLTLHSAQVILNREVRQQLPVDISDSNLWKKISKAREIYDLFNEIGVARISHVHSFSADEISRLTRNDIQLTISNVEFDYDIITLH